MTVYMGSARRHHSSNVTAALDGWTWIVIQTVAVTITARARPGSAYVTSVSTGPQELTVNTACLDHMVMLQQR